MDVSMYLEEEYIYKCENIVHYIRIRELFLENTHRRIRTQLQV